MNQDKKSKLIVQLLNERSMRLRAKIQSDLEKRYMAKEIKIETLNWAFDMCWEMRGMYLDNPDQEVLKEYDRKLTNLGRLIDQEKKQN